MNERMQNLININNMYLHVVRFIIFIVVVLGFSSIPVHADTRIDSNWGLSDANTAVDAISAGQSPNKIFIKDDKTFIIWTHDRSIVTNNNWEIRLQRFSYLGAKELNIAGKLLVSFNDSRIKTQIYVNDSGIWIIALNHLQLFNFDGDPQWSGLGYQLESGINNDFPIDPQLFPIDNTSVGIVWTDSRLISGNDYDYDQKYQRIGITGQSLLPEGNTKNLIVDVNNYYDLTLPRAITIKNNLYVVHILPWRIYLNKYNLDGENQWASAQIIADRPTGITLNNLFIIADNFDGIQIFWNDTRGSVGESFALNGERKWSSRDGLVLNSSEYSIINQPIYSQNHTFLPISIEIPSKSNSLILLKINEKGQNVWTQERKIFDSLFTGYNEKIDCNDITNLGILCAFTKNTASINYPSLDILLQGYTYNGDLIYNQPQTICNAYNNQRGPYIINDLNYGLVGTWSDYRSNQDFDVYAQRFLLDVSSPVTTLSINPSSPNGLNGYYNTIPQISLTAADVEHSGVKNIFYKWENDIIYSEYLNPINPTEGVQTISYYSIDNAGNSEAVKTLTIKVDTVPPNPNPTPEPTPIPTPVPVPTPIPSPIPEPVPVPTPDPTPTPNPVQPQPDSALSPDPLIKPIDAQIFSPIIKNLKTTKGVYAYNFNEKSIKIRPFGLDYKGVIFSKSIDFGPDGKLLIFINSKAYKKSQIKIYKENGKLIKSFNPYGNFNNAGFNASMIVETSNKAYLAISLLKNNTAVKTYQITPKGIKFLNSLSALNYNGNILLRFQKLYKNQYGLITQKKYYSNTLKVWKLNFKSNKFIEDKKVNKASLYLK